MIALPVPPRLLALLLVLAACPVHAADSAPASRPSVAEQARAIGSQVKEDAKAVGKAVKKEAKKIGDATKEQAAILRTKVKAHTGKADKSEAK